MNLQVVSEVDENIQAIIKARYPMTRNTNTRYSIAREKITATRDTSNHYTIT